MRIIGGQYKGKKLHTPENQSIRPTSDRVRESIFNRIEHNAYMPDIQRAIVLDLCCGTGAMGLEAVSRGAAHATFLDSHRESMALTKQNAAHLGVTDRCTFVQGDATKLAPASEPATLIFCDPPYASGLEQPILSALVRSGWAGPDSLVVLETDLCTDLAFDASWQSDTRKYGKTKVHFLTLCHPVA